MFKKKVKKIVTIGGGTGSFNILSELSKRKNSGDNLEIFAIVAMSDSGGSTGVLVDEYGVLPAGDVRQCLVALSPEKSFLRKLFIYRFENGFLDGHNFGNIFISAIQNLSGSFEKSIKEAGKLLKTSGKILPITLNKNNLVVELPEMKKIIGEGKIDNENILNYKKIYLENMNGGKVKLNHNINEVLENADLIIIAPGNFYNSIIPNFLVLDFAKKIKNVKAKKVMISNLTTKNGHTDNFSVDMFVSEIYKNSNQDDFIDYLFYNNNFELSKNITNAYKEEHSKIIKNINKQNFKKIKFIPGDFISKNIFENKNKSDKINRSLIRHDSKKIIDAILKI